jgi:cytochrome P450
MWSRFPPRMRRVLTTAAQLAASRGCDDVAVEHLLLAIATDREAAACFLFEHAGVPRETLVDELHALAPVSASAPIRQRAERLSSITMHVLDVAAGEADRRGDDHVGTEHVALALALLDHNPASVLLRKHGFTHELAVEGLDRWRAEGMPRWRKPANNLWLRWRWQRPIRRVALAPLLAWNVYVRRSIGHPRLITDPYPIYRWLRERHPVRKDPIAPVWVLTRYADVQLILRDPRFHKDPFAAERLPVTMRQQLGVLDVELRQADVTTVSMLFLDPPAHTRVRGVFTRAFTPRMIEGLRPRIQQITDKRIDKAIASGNGEMDIIETIAYPLPVIVIAELLGFPPEDYPRFKKWSDDFAAALGFTPTAQQQAAAARSREELREYFTSLVPQIQSRTRDTSLLAVLLAMEKEPTALSREELFINIALLLAAGHETTTNLIGNGMLSLLRHPDQLKLLREDPSLIESAVEELLRFESPVQWVSRVVAEPLELGGHRLQTGDLLLGCLGAANRDPLAFTNPDQLDIRRSDNRHLAFGSGIHFCLGAALARMEGQIAIGTLVSRLTNVRLAHGARVKWKRGLTFRAMERLRVAFDV